MRRRRRKNSRRLPPLPPRRTALPPAPTGPDFRLATFVLEIGDRPRDNPRAAIAPKLKAASLRRAHALHLCVRMGDPKLLGVLCDLDRDAVNAFDSDGLTPLMVAAAEAGEAFATTSRRRLEPALEAIECLLARGADTALADAVGWTALGHLRASRRDAEDFGGAVFRRRRVDYDVDALLMPADGPTPADDDQLGY